MGAEGSETTFLNNLHRMMKNQHDSGNMRLDPCLDPPSPTQTPIYIWHIQFSVPDWNCDPHPPHPPCTPPGEKIRSGSITLAVSEAHMWAKWLFNPCHLGGPQRSGRGGN